MKIKIATTTLLFIFSIVIFSITSCVKDQDENQFLENKNIEISDTQNTKAIEGITPPANSSKYEPEFIDVNSGSLNGSSSDCCIECNSSITFKKAPSLPNQPLGQYWQVDVYERCPGGSLFLGGNNSTLLGPSFATFSSLVYSAKDKVVLPNLITDEHDYFFIVGINPQYFPPDTPVEITITDAINSYDITLFDFLANNFYSQKKTLHCNNYTTNNCWNKTNRICCFATGMGPN